MTNWIPTFQSRFDFVNPTTDMVNFDQGAMILGRINRFNGWTLQGPYSVAQHCVEGARAILRDTGRRDAAAAFLLHDFHEAYIGDDTTPKVRALAHFAADAMGWKWHGDIVKDAFKEMKRRADAVIYAKAGIAFPLPADVQIIVADYDIRMARMERERTGPCQWPWHEAVERAQPIDGLDLSSWGPHLATSLWRAAFREFVPGVSGAPALVPEMDAGCDCCALPGDGDWRGWPDVAPSQLAKQSP